MTDARDNTYRDVCTERMLDTRMAALTAELWQMVVWVERSTTASLQPGAEDDIEHARR
jgi:hypothetical protein